MAYRSGNREQSVFFPPSIEEYVSVEDPVRAYDAFINALNFKELDIEMDEMKVGNPQYNPTSMMKLLVYGCSYGFRSSRKLERAAHQNLSFIWIMSGLKPDHKTISEFRRKNKKALKQVLRQCARMCIEFKLIEGNTLFVDGTKIRANAGIKNSWTQQGCLKALKKVDKRIDEILSECEERDLSEENEPSLTSMRKELKNKKNLKAKMESIVKELNESQRRSINTVDSDCERMNSIQGTHAGYNVQNVVDAKHGLIVSTDVINDNNDLGQFSKQIRKANETLGKKSKIACADAGYAKTEELEKIDKKNIKVIVPSARQVSKKEASSFDKEKFIYDSENDCYLCPEGHMLTYRSIRAKSKSKVYKIKNSFLCKNCRHFGICTKDKHSGREVNRLLNEDLRRKFEAQYNEVASREIYKLRKQKVELPFGHIKRNLKVGGFLLRGLEGVKAEASLFSTCFNLSRMITIFGVTGLISKLIS